MVGTYMKKRKWDGDCYLPIFILNTSKAALRLVYKAKQELCF
jgi:hypothetical protein